MIIRVPATSANIGPGFDSVGVALSSYLTIEILEKRESWFVEHSLDFVPDDESNLLIKSALKVTNQLQPYHIRMTSDIPLARGLGSSSSVIVAGIELANQIASLGLTPHQKLEIATKIEGHPDNVAPAIFGNLVISSYVQKNVEAVVAPFPDCAFLAFIPTYQLRTSDSRNVLPTQFSYKNSVAASSVANVAIASLLTGDLVTAGRAIEGDLFHEQFRQKLVKEFHTIKQISRENGAYATYLSGAGPTVMTLLPWNSLEKMKHALEEEGLEGEIRQLTVDTTGILVQGSL
ncbi:homoserine kinase [Streptococcus sp. DD13]|uniref:homoserine kinase n=1 Tax=Streptococcus sp. DD13 TaxID=1777881 RepID=UPI00079553BD|nr:homoserine kinase [Streptococcus sp. DD13]KXT78862.1 Homoserine kinase [Streptococcus sp. DD13]